MRRSHARSSFLWEQVPDRYTASKADQCRASTPMEIRPMQKNAATWNDVLRFDPDYEPVEF
jgi:hypothetical protein